MSPCPLRFAQRQESVGYIAISFCQIAAYTTKQRDAFCSFCRTAFTLPLSHLRKTVICVYLENSPGWVVCRPPCVTASLRGETLLLGLKLCAELCQRPCVKLADTRLTDAQDFPYLHVIEFFNVIES